MYNTKFSGNNERYFGRAHWKNKNEDLVIDSGLFFYFQFYYGEDGLDISKTGFLSPKQFPFLTDNSETGSKGNAFDKKVAKRMKKVDILLTAHRIVRLDFYTY